MPVIAPVVGTGTTNNYKHFRLPGGRLIFIEQQGVDVPYYSDDGGQTITAIGGTYLASLKTEGAGLSVSAVPKTDYVLALGGGKLYVSDDGGATFDAEYDNTNFGTQNASAVFGAVNGSAYVGTVSGKIFRSTAAPYSTWVEVYSATHMAGVTWFAETRMANAGDIYAAGNFQRTGTKSYVYSTDNGATWTEHATPPETACYCVVEALDGTVAVICAAAAISEIYLYTSAGRAGAWTKKQTYTYDPTNADPQASVYNDPSGIVYFGIPAENKARIYAGRPPFTNLVLVKQFTSGASATDTTMAWVA